MRAIRHEYSVTLSGSPAPTSLPIRLARARMARTQRVGKGEAAARAVRLSVTGSTCSSGSG